MYLDVRAIVPGDSSSSRFQVPPNPVGHAQHPPPNGQKSWIWCLTVEYHNDQAVRDQNIIFSLNAKLNFPERLAPLGADELLERLDRHFKGIDQDFTDLAVPVVEGTAGSTSLGVM
jgi:hypothetical protein